MLKPIAYCILFIALSLKLSGQEVTFSGTITDGDTGEELIGASILVGTVGTVSDYDGSFRIAVPKGIYDIEVSYVGYKSFVENVDLNEDVYKPIRLKTFVLNEVVVTADIAIDRKTPIAFSNISTLKIEEELAAQDLPLLLNSTPGIYATQSGGGDGDARITIRGFNQRNMAVMLDGVPVNDMENGWVYWSNWFGLDLVTKTTQVQRGLGASKLAIPSVGGTINILTKGIDSKRSVRFRQEIGNDAYVRTTLGVSSGKLKNDWAFSFAGSYKERDGWVGGTFSKGWFYYGRIDKYIGNHLVTLQGFGAPQSHGQRPFSVGLGLIDSSYAVGQGIDPSLLEEIPFRDMGRQHNEHWGYLDGEAFSLRKNFYHKPQISLRHSWQINEDAFISNVAYLSLGNGGGTANYDKGFPTVQDGPNRGLVDFDQAIELNKPSFFNPNGYADYFLRASVNNHFWTGLLSTLKKSWSDGFSTSFGVDGRYYEGLHYREVYDLLGSPGGSSEGLQVGDRFDYDYTGFVGWLGVFALAEKEWDRVTGFVNLSAANVSYRIEDYVKNASLDWVSIPGFTFKSGASFRLNDNQDLFMNMGYLSKAQRFNNVINQNRFGEELLVFNNYENERVRAIELGYKGRYEKIAYNINTYYTNWLNKPLDRPPTVPLDPSDPDSERIPINIPGIDAIHRGIEIDFAYKASSKLTIDGLLSVGDWFWNSGGEVSVQLPNGRDVFYEFDATGVKVGDAAQLQAGGQVRWAPFKGFYTKITGTYFGNHFANFQPETLQLENAQRQSWQAPNYSVYNFHTGYTRDIGKIKASLRFNILNLFDTTYISDARNNDGFVQIANNGFDARSASVHFGTGRQWNTSLTLSF